MKRKSLGPIDAIPGQHAHALTNAQHEHPEAIVLYLVNSVGARQQARRYEAQGKGQGRKRKDMRGRYRDCQAHAATHEDGWPARLFSYSVCNSRTARRANRLPVDSPPRRVVFTIRYVSARH
jgi:hypothetical protein